MQGINGYIKEEVDQVIYEIPKSQTNVMEAEQLDELNKKDALFFDVQRYTVEDDIVRIYYKKPQDYTALSSLSSTDSSLRRKVAINILEVARLVGTQYTTMIHPDNIYVNQQGDVKFAQRGIRFVLSTDELTNQQVIRDLRSLTASILTGVRYADIKQSNINELAVRYPYVRDIQQAKTVDQLRHAIDQSASVAVTAKPGVSEAVETKPKVEKPKAEKQEKSWREKMQKYATLKVTVPAGIVLGMVAGMLLLYMIKVVPMAEATTSENDQQQQQQEELEQEKVALEAELAKDDKLLEGYRMAVTGKTEEAITSFESVEQLDEEAQRTLVEQYIDLGTVESLTQASQLDPSYNVQIVDKLKSIEGQESKEAILALESDAPEVTIEQAWVNKDFDSVVAIYQDISDNDRAKYLAGRSYVELKKDKEALEIGKELNNEGIQVNSLNIQKDKINNNDDLDDDEKEERIEKIDEQIDDIQG
ncbi:type VII secretion protein EssB/YukC [Gracilibacillus timonensis]|uniref:type VII secretion protein EssB/YukC n=1 Tax=Gracilibacillus timonensis TaxID=1816696 RepID=UPI000825D10F|nr:type VII secretion protein EssB/YukC [Gracilibacillus timonensis]